MPNNVMNEIQFDCSEERFVEIAKFIKPDGNYPLGCVDFNKLIPMPEALDIECGSRGDEGYAAYRTFVNDTCGMEYEAKSRVEEKYKAKFVNDPEIWELGKRYYENLRLYGAKTWYDWCWDHWDTKWNAYDCSEVETFSKYLLFNTAWSSVPSIVGALSRRYPDVTITYRWADEDIGSNVGMFVIKNGVVLDEYIPDDGSAAAFELAAEVMDYDLAELGYTLSEDGSTYEWNEEDCVDW